MAQRELPKSKLSALTKLPWICASRTEIDQLPILLIRGESGYIPAEGIISNPDRFNQVLGIDAFQAEAMLAGSMMGWHIPGCDPDVYREKGMVPVRGSHIHLQEGKQP